MDLGQVVSVDRLGATTARDEQVGGGDGVKVEVVAEVHAIVIHSAVGQSDVLVGDVDEEAFGGELGVVEVAHHLVHRGPGGSAPLG
eukprot:JZ551158.1.p4 GENE.JZ551158.1~~JZ551158.1.p4  ORF type:complete len:86 (-),score=30.95 JZ551158.1:163-420(-)